MLMLKDLQSFRIPPSDLKMDVANPRLKDLGQGISEGMTEKELIKRLVLTSDIQELLLSIASNGYVPFEPLIVTGEKPFKVLEGNRRIAAIRLILQPALARELNVNVPEMSQDVLNTLDAIEVVRVEREQDAWPYIGFKHVNGPHKWSSLSKARFAANWFRQGGVTIEQISNHLGDKNATVRKMLDGIFVLEQAEHQGLFSIDNRLPEKAFAFSHLYTALTRKEYREYLQIGPTTSIGEPNPEPVTPTRFDALRKMLLWMYGDKAESIPSVIASQNPDLGRLGKVLVDPVALAILEQRRSLDLAFGETIPKEQAFRESLVAAYSSGRDAMGLVYSYQGGDERLEEIASDLRNIADKIYGSMKTSSARAGKADGGTEQ
ncbi:MAG: hypothetical protein Q7U56_10440 [Humidesulfovibrio sp.]|nr:hypothetical protein [Humidesulfovibrio sp.]